MIKQQRVVTISYVAMTVLLAMVWLLKLATPFIAVFFSFLALEHFKLFNRKWVAIAIFTFFVAAIFWGFISFAKEAVDVLPKIADRSIPIAVEMTTKWGLDLPFNNRDSLKAVVVNAVQSELQDLARFAQIATKEFVFLIIGLVVAAAMFLNGKIDLAEDTYSIKSNLYSVLVRELGARVRTFYASFRVVMGAQIIISMINTFFTALFVYLIDLPYAHIVVVVTFLCGLLPIIGNLISNTIIISIAVTTSTKLALMALGFLVALHKFEYFLNSKIIGGRIKNPMWLTLLGLVLGESIMGIPGMILAPVILHYVKQECAKIEIIP